LKKEWFIWKFWKKGGGGNEIHAPCACVIYELCCEETEDVKHFLLICPTLNDIREEHLYTLKCYLNNIQEGAYEAICENKQLIQLILDSSMDILKGIVTLTKRNHIDIEQITRTLCYCLHVKRTRLSAKLVLHKLLPGCCLGSIWAYIGVLLLCHWE
jgi:hypothetical protein